MKIAQVSPLFESVPPRMYGGTERIVSYLTECLVGQGHEVTLFASGDSITKAELIPACPKSLRLDTRRVDHLAYHLLMLEQVARMAGDFDLIHTHLDYLPYSLARRWKTPALGTLHGRLDLPDLVPVYQEFSDIRVVSISNAQRLPIPHANWMGTVYHGLPKNHYSLHLKSESYLAFLGRISPEKRVDRAIHLARRVGLTLKIAAKVDRADQTYYDTEIKPLIDADPRMEFIGEIMQDEKDDFLGNAMALVFLIDWPEPFGLVMIEAMACGTPVIAWRRGSVPEIIEHGVTGFIVNSEEEAVKAVARLPELDRKEIRRRFEERFTVERMTNDYLRLYHQMAVKDISPV